ncbi:hypothetical protein [Actinacidiphila soli]|uniref:hypothetical protein n=1 Tax=Actinacidiphila soli TaxID=2487275 RepID=UPI000FCAF037|nr:hypothetical protein [Actinacidiphila soli]
MTTPREKVSITLPPDLAKRARAASGGNLSDFAAKALEEKLLNDGMAEYRRLRAADPVDDVLDAIEADAA